MLVMNIRALSSGVVLVVGSTACRGIVQTHDRVDDGGRSEGVGAGGSDEPQDPARLDSGASASWEGGPDVTVTTTEPSDASAGPVTAEAGPVVGPIVECGDVSLIVDDMTAAAGPTLTGGYWYTYSDRTCVSALPPLIRGDAGGDGDSGRGATVSRDDRSQ
jgi:hypothetical protein